VFGELRWVPGELLLVYCMYRSICVHLDLSLYRYLYLYRVDPKGSRSPARARSCSASSGGSPGSCCRYIYISIDISIHLSLSLSFSIYLSLSTYIHTYIYTYIYRGSHSPARARSCSASFGGSPGSCCRYTVCIDLYVSISISLSIVISISISIGFRVNPKGSHSPAQARLCLASSGGSPESCCRYMHRSRVNPLHTSFIFFTGESWGEPGFTSLYLHTVNLSRAHAHTRTVN